MSGTMSIIEGMASADSIDARALERMRNAQRRIRAEQLRAAEAQDRVVQQRLAALRARVTDESIAAARELEALRADATRFRRMAAAAEEGDETVAAEAERLRQRLRLIPRPIEDPD